MCSLSTSPCPGEEALTRSVADTACGKIVPAAVTAGSASNTCRRVDDACAGEVRSRMGVTWFGLSMIRALWLANQAYVVSATELRGGVVAGARVCGGRWLAVPLSNGFRINFRCLSRQRGLK